MHDIVRDIKVNWKDVAALKGKTVRKVPSKVNTADDLINIIVDRNLVLCVDIFFVSGIPFLLSVSKRLCLMMARYLADRAAGTVKAALDMILSQYNSHNFKVCTILCDREGAIGALKTHVESKGIAMNPTSKNEHVPDIERAGRTLKERVRSFWNSIPYKLALIMVVYLVYYCVRTINMFPKSGTLSQNLSPRELFLGRRINYNKECKIACRTKLGKNQTQCWLWRLCPS